MDMCIVQFPRFLSFIAYSCFNHKTDIEISI